MEKKKHTVVEMLGYLIISMVIGIPIQIYTAWILLKVIGWYHIPVVLSLPQVWVIIVIYSLFKRKPESPNEDFPDQLKSILKQLGPLSFIFGLIYLVHLVWN